MAKKGIYIYGIVPNIYETEKFRLLEGFEVYAIPFKNISAIVSNKVGGVPDFSDVESLAHLLVRHQKTLEGVMDSGFTMILPMKLGTVANDMEEVFRILSRGYDLITATLKNIQHQTEIDVAITWADFGGILKEVVNHPDIVLMKDNMLKNIDNLSQVDHVKIGMLIQDKLEEKNKLVGMNILESLSSLSIEVRNHEVMNDQMIINSAFLINRSNYGNFEQEIDLLDEEYKGLLNFKLVGPLPCYSFYTIEVTEVNQEQLELARKDLGLKEEPSENEIKRAYQEKAKEFHPDMQKNKLNEGNFNRINKAYRILLEYSEAAKQVSKDGNTFQTNDKATANLILVKIKE